jgi:hypothetical protein
MIDWLLQGDPAIRWQTLRDLTDTPDEEIARERARVSTEGWGARILSLQADDGHWGRGIYSPKWISTTYTLLLLRHFGIDPASRECQAAINRVRARVTWRGSRPFFEYLGETCVTGMVLALSAYFVSAEGSDAVVDFLLGEQLDDGGWNCETRNGSIRSSFNTTISVLEGLLEYERSNGVSAPAILEARVRAHEYLLERSLLRFLSTGEIINPRWKLFSFPPRWHYDILRGLVYFRDVGVPFDERFDEAVAIVQAKRRTDGTWPLQNHYAGKEHFKMEPGPGKPSRWNTLRALRVLQFGDSPTSELT